MDDKPIKVVRQASYKNDILTLTGTISGVRSPARVMPCTRLENGILCEKEFGPVLVTVMTNHARMIETIVETKSKSETAGVAYECDRPVHRR